MTVGEFVDLLSHKSDSSCKRTKKGVTLRWHKRIREWRCHSLIRYITQFVSYNSCIIVLSMSRNLFTSNSAPEISPSFLPSGVRIRYVG